MSQIKISRLPLIDKITLDDVLIVNDGNTTTSHITWRDTIRTLERTNLTFVSSVALDGNTRIGDFTYYSQEHLRKYPGILITSDQITNWDESYGWGNHADAGYLDGSYTPDQSNYAETDTSKYTFIRNKPRLDIDANGDITNVNVNLSYTSLNNSGEVENDSGTGFIIPGATTSSAGLMTTLQTLKLDSIEPNAQRNVQSDWDATSGDALILNKPYIISDLTVEYVSSPTDGTITVTAGAIIDTATVNVVNSTDAGLITPGDKVSLDTLTDALISASGDVEIYYTDIIGTPIVNNDIDGNVSNIKVDLGYTAGLNNGTITNTKGDNAIILAASSTRAGLMSRGDKDKLDGIEDGAEVNVDTTQTYVASGTDGTLTLSPSGDTTTLPIADTTNAGLMSPGDKSKLDGLEDGAQANVQSDWNATSGDAFILNKPTLVETLDDLTDVTAAAPSSGDVLLYNGSAWVSSGLGSTILYGGVHDFTGAAPSPLPTDPSIYIHKGTADSDNVGTDAEYKNIIGDDITNGDRVIYDPNDGTSPWIIITGITDTPDTNLSYDDVTHIVSNDNGSGFELPLVSGTVDGLMSIADKASLEDLIGNKHDPSTQSYQSASDKGTLTLSPSGDTTEIPIATTSDVGLMSSDDKTKLDSVDPGAQVNVDPTQEYDQISHKLTLTPGDDETELPMAGDKFTDLSGNELDVDGLMSAGDKAKLDDVNIDSDNKVTNIKTELGYTVATDKGTVTETNSVTGSVIPLANTVDVNVNGVKNAGLMTAAQAAAVDDLILNPPTGATNLGYTPATDGGTVTSSTGTNSTLPMAGATFTISNVDDTPVAGLMSPGDKDKLDGIEAGAQVNVQSDWSQSNITEDDFIKNKPSVIDTVVSSGLYATKQSTNTDPDNSSRLDGGQITIDQVVTDYGTDPNTPSQTPGTSIVVTLPIVTDTDDGLMSALDKVKYDAKLNDDAPADTYSYGRKDETWSKVLPYDFTTLPALT